MSCPSRLASSRPASEIATPISAIPSTATFRDRARSPAAVLPPAAAGARCCLQSAGQPMNWTLCAGEVNVGLGDHGLVVARVGSLKAGFGRFQLALRCLQMQRQVCCSCAAWPLIVEYAKTLAPEPPIKTRTRTTRAIRAGNRRATRRFGLGTRASLPAVPHTFPRGRPIALLAANELRLRWQPPRRRLRAPTLRCRQRDRNAYAPASKGTGRAQRHPCQRVWGHRAGRLTDLRADERSYDPGWR